jgi:DNA-binding CsgD family transcriptional regulator
MSKPPIVSLLLGLIAVQLVCTAFFVNDVASDYLIDMSLHFGTELFAVLALISAILTEGWLVWDLLKRNNRLTKSLDLARSAMGDIIESHLDQWNLTDSERDVARLLIKGMNISDIATARQSANGTVKVHLNAIYRKSGVRNRGELMSLLFDSLGFA